ncbi:hypothetical protein FB446DRAFT_337312 [Lentinula raphanica]|nr:hypothetical protein FB446DRAFT_337312 [Lentinula raphanica]
MLLSSFVLGLVLGPVLASRAAPTKPPTEPPAKVIVRFSFTPDQSIDDFFQDIIHISFTRLGTDSPPLGLRSGTPTGSHPSPPLGSRPGTPTTTVDVDVDVDYETRRSMSEWRERLEVHEEFELNYVNSYTDDISENEHDFRFWGDGVGALCKTKAGGCRVELNRKRSTLDPSNIMGHILYQDPLGERTLPLLSLPYSIREQALQHQRDRQRGSTSAHAR